MKFMIEKLKEINPILIDLIILDILYLIIGEAIIFIFVPNSVFYGIGFLAGVLFSIFAAVHMGKTLATAVYYEGNGAVRKTLLGYGIRLVAVAGMLILLFVTGIGDVFCAFLGMLALKVSAYLQPVTDRIFKKILKKGG